MQRRLVFSGFPCPKAPWQKFLPGSDVVPFAEVLDAVGKADFRAMAAFVLDEIQKRKPTSVVCHDYAVPYTVMAFARAKKKGIALNAKLTVFNGAVRGFDVIHGRHAFFLQWTTWKKFCVLAEENGGEVDQSLKRHYGTILKMYRQAIAFDMMDKAKGMLGQNKPLGLDLGVPSQIIASPEDRFVKVSALERLKEDFQMGELHVVKYGHFPYSKNAEISRNLVEDFEGLKR